MRIRLSVTLSLALILLLLAVAVAYGQSASSTDILLPSSFHIAQDSTRAYDANGNSINVGGSIDLVRSGGAVYMSIPASAPAGAVLSLLQDTSTGALFRNNTMVLPVNTRDRQTAYLILAMDSVSSDGGRLNGRVTGLMLNTPAITSGNDSASFIVYLKGLPDNAGYSISMANDHTIEQAIIWDASKNDPGDSLRLMASVSGMTKDAQSSIGYVVVKMKPYGQEPYGNVSVYRYDKGAAAKLPCNVVRTADGATVYEAISPGSGTFALIGAFSQVSNEKTSPVDMFIVGGILAALIIALVVMIRRVTKKD